MAWPILLRRLAAPIIHRRPASGLQPARLYAYLDALHERRSLEGAVLEVGCHVGGTAAIAWRFLNDIGHPKRYVCLDTFSGFVEGQYRHDQGHGLSRAYRTYFAENSIGLTRSLLARHGCDAVELVQDDIATVPAAELPEPIAVCLLDVDLEIPVYEGLKRIHPRLARGGVILVDDCRDGTSWVGARIGYRRFVQEAGLPERYIHGFGVVERR